MPIIFFNRQSQAGGAVSLKSAQSLIKDGFSIMSGDGGIRNEEGAKSEKPNYVKDNRVPQDKEMALSSKVKGAQVYKNGDQYYYRDTFHSG